MNTNIETFKYDNRIVRAFAIATVVWGIVGMLVGLLAAVQLFFPDANLNLQFITFGRIRPLHTNAVIFAFVGNGMFMGIYYSLQRLCKARMFSDFLSWFNFWGWQAIIVARGDHAAARLHDEQGIRGTGMADQDRHRGRLGGVRGESVRHHRQAPRKTHVCGDLVLHRHGRDGRGAAHHELDDDAGGLVQELFDVCRRAGRAGAMVVWPQRRRVLPHDAVSRPDVLFSAEGGEPAGVFATGFRSFIFGRWCFSTSGPGRIICFTRRCRTGRNRSAWFSR